ALMRVASSVALLLGGMALASCRQSSPPALNGGPDTSTGSVDAATGLPGEGPAASPDIPARAGADAAAGGEEATAAASSNVDSGAPLTLKDSGKSLDLKIGDAFTVQLHGNSGTGFTWEITQGDTNVVAPKGSTAPSGTNQPGGPSVQTFVFVAKS